ncbi:unnamed protein product [Amoebophrya sp. A25]|nr:unnamed protein product [Amoebophrya sp. A25]|eukprot:GSA25T00011194001.1
MDGLYIESRFLGSAAGRLLSTKVSTYATSQKNITPTPQASTPSPREGESQPTSKTTTNADEQQALLAQLSGNSFDALVYRSRSIVRTIVWTQMRNFVRRLLFGQRYADIYYLDHSDCPWLRGPDAIPASDRTVVTQVLRSGYLSQIYPGVIVPNMILDKVNGNADAAQFPELLKHCRSLEFRVPWQPAVQEKIYRGGTSSAGTRKKRRRRGGSVTTTDGAGNNDEIEGGEGETEGQEQAVPKKPRKMSSAFMLARAQMFEKHATVPNIEAIKSKAGALERREGPSTKSTSKTTDGAESPAASRPAVEEEDTYPKKSTSKKVEAEAKGTRDEGRSRTSTVDDYAYGNHDQNKKASPTRRVGGTKNDQKTAEQDDHDGFLSVDEEEEETQLPRSEDHAPHVDPRYQGLFAETSTGAEVVVSPVAPQKTNKKMNNARSEGEAAFLADQADDAARHHLMDAIAMYGGQAEFERPTLTTHEISPKTRDSKLEPHRSNKNNKNNTDLVHSNAYAVAAASEKQVMNMKMKNNVRTPSPTPTAEDSISVPKHEYDKLLASHQRLQAEHKQLRRERATQTRVLAQMTQMLREMEYNYEQAAALLRELQQMEPSSAAVSPDASPALQHLITHASRCSSGGRGAPKTTFQNANQKQNFSPSPRIKDVTTRSTEVGLSPAEDESPHQSVMTVVQPGGGPTSQNNSTFVSENIPTTSPPPVYNSVRSRTPIDILIESRARDLRELADCLSFAVGGTSGREEFGEGGVG